MATYPSHWPRPKTYSSESGRATRPTALINRITEEEKEALYLRRITTRALAQKYGVNESYVSKLFPGKAVNADSLRQMKIDKRELRAVRKQFRLSLAAKVLEGVLSTAKAADEARITYREMARAVKYVREGGK
jgi:hypothetical protein